MYEKVITLGLQYSSMIVKYFNTAVRIRTSGGPLWIW